MLLLSSVSTRMASYPSSSLVQAMNVCNGIHTGHPATPFNNRGMTSSLRLQFERMGFGIQNPFVQTD